MSQTTPDATRAEAAADGDESDPHDCPLCDHADVTEADVYSHLMVTHRKSTLSEALLDARTDRE
jgi:hypothetical protein